METVEALKSIWELVSNVDPSGHSASAANTSDSIESGLAPCYNMPYGATGMFIHLAFAWAILMLYLRRTPFVPWAGLSRPTIAVAFLEADPWVVELRSWRFVLITALAASLTAGMAITVTMSRTLRHDEHFDQVLSCHALAAATIPLGLAAYITRKRISANLYGFSNFQNWSKTRCYLVWLLASLAWLLVIGYSWTDWVFALMVHQYGGWVLGESSAKATVTWIVYMFACSLPMFSY
ncbi:hypothetical protein EJ07DRAFT_158321 [Lizonia empirigonia]|nr:hypothetical protein EJ07DRAFT_158321 [Lizonia empirigonia]